LSDCTAPIRTAELKELVNAKQPEMGQIGLNGALATLNENGLACFFPQDGGPYNTQAEWALTSKGWRALAEHVGSAEAAEHTPAKDVDPPISVATVCVAEPELDAWWKSLDVEAKADAFVMFSLTQFKDTHLDVSAPIPYSVVDPALVPREA
jgi:hypothetical protein